MVSTRHTCRQTLFSTRLSRSSMEARSLAVVAEPAIKFVRMRFFRSSSAILAFQERRIVLVAITIVTTRAAIATAVAISHAAETWNSPRRS
jgi:hypothetical protein